MSERTVLLGRMLVLLEGMDFILEAIVTVTDRSVLRLGIREVVFGA